MKRWLSEYADLVLGGIFSTAILVILVVACVDACQRQRDCEALGGHIVNVNCAIVMMPMSCGENCTTMIPIETCDERCDGLPAEHP